ncbi:hypothetical protein CONLIGDRAFT_112351 [Coniochaeta ligniaria NRRL 30616]|uniref:Uncharacterized protein n=1 Tax=Coniochaeta ligniaria NRRL 30616 TaxID=1408157 RepID=A0A1J7I8T9_9PEZI|nr:hypothetical protein CONLIGDRAFT_112351 [Coniochaeta ligniaria NRRL 30616]
MCEVERNCWMYVPSLYWGRYVDRWRVSSPRSSHAAFVSTPACYSTSTSLGGGGSITANSNGRVSSRTRRDILDALCIWGLSEKRALGVCWRLKDGTTPGWGIVDLYGMQIRLRVWSHCRLGRQPPATVPALMSPISLHAGGAELSLETLCGQGSCR